MAEKNHVQHPTKRISYIEPNYAFNIDSSVTTNGKTIMQAPTLEDYCIALDIETELVDRTCNAHLPSSFSNATESSNVIVLSWSTRENGSMISFMSGRKIYASQEDKDKKAEKRVDENGIHWVNSLTTDYTGAYYDEMEHHGTTELFGIKSVKISYNHLNVPIMDIIFTDVRGASLFGQAQRRQNKKYLTYNGLSADDMAEAFFQCFFTFPKPKFRMTVKGFYGNPVSYEMNNISFNATFNSDSGNFEITTKFEGFYYSFLSDVSMSALLAAPYAPYYGSAYWKDRNFTLKDGETMPTLVELYEDVNKVYGEVKANEENTPEAKEHAQNIAKKSALEKLIEVHGKLVDALTNAATEKVGGSTNVPLRIPTFIGEEVTTGKAKEPVSSDSNNGQTENVNTSIALIAYLLKDNENHMFETWIGSTNSYYTSALEQLKALNAGITAYNNEYGQILTAYPETVNTIAPYKNVITCSQRSSKLQISLTNNASQTSTLKKWVTLVKDKVNNRIAASNQNALSGMQHILFIDLSAIMKIENELKNVQDALGEYNSDENTDRRNQKEAAAIKEKLGSIFSIENVVRITMAHFETFMHMMYKCVQEIKDSHRTLQSMGISTTGETCITDINPNQASSDGGCVIPPFPAVGITKNDNNDTKTASLVNGWVGDIASSRFAEMDLVLSFFNGADTVGNRIAKSDMELAKILNANNSSSASTGVEDVVNELSNGNDVGAYHLKNIVNLFDIFTDGYVYPQDKSVVNDRSTFIKAISLRAFATLAIDYYAANATRQNVIGQLGKADGYNFAEQHTANQNSEIYKFIQSSTDDDFANETWKEVTSSKPLFTNKNNLYWLRKYPIKNGFAYPIQSYELNDEASSYASASQNYIKHILNSGEEVKAAYARKNLPYRIVEFSKAKKVNSVISEKIKDANYSSAFSDLLTQIKFDSSSYGKMLDASKQLILVLKDNKYHAAGQSDLDGIGDDETGIKRDTLYLSSCHTCKKTNGKYEIINTHPSGRNAQYSSVTRQDTGQVYYYPVSALKDTNSIRIAARDVGSAIIPKIGGLYKTNYVIVGKKLKGDYFLYYYVPISVCQTSKTPNELYYCDAYQNAGTRGYKAALILTCLDVIKTEEVHNAGGHNFGLGTGAGTTQPFIFVPKLVALQLGAMAYYWNKADITTLLPVKDNKVYMMYLNRLNASARSTLANYFIDNCVNTNFVSQYENNVKANKIPFLKDFSNDLLSPVMLIKLSICADPGSNLTSGSKTHNLNEHLTFTENTYKSYMGGFLEGLKEAWNTGTVVSTENTNRTNNNTELVASSPNTTKEMYASLYSYLKLMYDRWIPNFSEDEWKMENFFDTGSTTGHSFHFIDAYYTEVGMTANVNLQSIAGTIRNLTTQNNYTSNLFQFLTNIFQQNYFMLVCTQNFMDLSNEQSMNNMFKPVSYLSMAAPKRHPDFVAIYTFEPSKRLEIANGQYNDDSFMLDGSNNDNLPLPLQSSSANEQNPYKLPAFGVAYGMQNQNYFTEISVDMNEAQATEVSIATKFGIVEENMKMQGKTANFIGQDLFDVYSTNSWQCTVKMMGNAWVQPLMYFCLTNIPMFRGAYIIYKVVHDITPGNMTTTITGMRMSKIATPFNQNPVIGGVSQLDAEAQAKLAHKYANITNNCEYEVNPLFEEDAQGENKTELLKTTVNDKFWTSGHAPASQYVGIPLGEAIARCIKGEDASDDIAITLHAITFYNYSMKRLDYLCDTNQWNAYKSFHELDNHIYDIVKKVFANPGYAVSLNMVTKPNTERDQKVTHDGAFFKQGASLNVPVKLTAKELSVMSNALGDSAYWKNPKKGNWTHRNNLDAICKHNKTIYWSEPGEKSRWKSNNSTSNNATKDKVDITDAYFNALQKTINTAEAAACILTKTVVDKNNNIIDITQKDGKTDHLAQVFDVALNAYYEYTQNVTWVLGSDSDFIKENPIVVRVQIQSDGKTTNRTVRMAIKSGNKLNAKDGEFAYETEISANYGRALYKQYANNDAVYNKEVKTKVKDMKDKIKLTECSTFINPNNGGDGAKLVGNKYLGADKWNAGAAADYLLTYKRPLNDSGGWCAAAVKSAIAIGGIPYISDLSGKQTVQGYIDNCHFVELGKGDHVLNDATYKQLLSNAQIGDICSFWNSTPGHVAMYCGNNTWISDYLQNPGQASPSQGFNGRWQYARYSANGGAVKNTDTTVVHWKHSYYEKGITEKVIH